MRSNHFILSTVGIVVLNGLITTSFAAEAYKAKVISQNEWSTGMAKGDFKEKAHSTRIQRAISQSTSSVYSYIKSSTGNVGQFTSINSRHAFHITNHSKSTSRYKIEASICAKHIQNTPSCLYMNNVIEIEPDGYYASDLEPSLKLTYDQTGTYTITASSFINSIFDDSSAIKLESISESNAQIS